MWPSGALTFPLPRSVSVFGLSHSFYLLLLSLVEANYESFWPMRVYHFAARILFTTVLRYKVD